MNMRALRVAVLDPSDDEYYTIEQMLALCGVYHYDVAREYAPEAALESIARRDAQCYIVSENAWRTWLAQGHAEWISEAPIVVLSDQPIAGCTTLDPADMSLGGLLIAMRGAMRRRQQDTVHQHAPMFNALPAAAVS